MVRSIEADHTVVTDQLLGLYRRYLGEPEQLSDVYIGFGLFFGGLALGVVGVVVFLWSSSIPAQSMSRWQLREIAITLTMLGLPAFLLSILVLLPTDRRSMIGGGVGSFICLFGAGIFVTNYPYNWNVPGSDASALGITVYAIGAVVATAAVGAALASNYIAQSTTAGDVDSTQSSDTAEDSVSDDQVQADIDEAMSSTELSWGGVEKDDTKRLKIRTDETDIDRSGFDGKATEHRAAGTDVDNAVHGLQQLRGGEVDETTSEGTDAQADALRQLREQQQEASTDETGWLTRFRERFGL